MSELAGKVERHRRALAATTYAEHAAIQSINVYLLDALAARKQVDLYVDWLTRLAGRREAEIDAGTWPVKVGTPR